MGSGNRRLDDFLWEKFSEPICYGQVYAVYKYLVEQALIQTKNNKTAAAKLLGIERTTLHEMIKRIESGEPLFKSFSYRSNAKHAKCRIKV